MKILACIVMALMPLTTAAQVADWSPTPLVINVPDWVHAYHKDTNLFFLHPDEPLKYGSLSKHTSMMKTNRWQSPMDTNNGTL